MKAANRRLRRVRTMAWRLGLEATSADARTAHYARDHARRLAARIAGKGAAR